MSFQKIKSRQRMYSVYISLSNSSMSVCSFFLTLVNWLNFASTWEMHADVVHFWHWSQKPFAIWTNLFFSFILAAWILKLLLMQKYDYLFRYIFFPFCSSSTLSIFKLYQKLMILGKQVSTPSFPPPYLLFSLIILNLVLHMFTANQNLYKILIYIYGMMILYDIKLSENYLSYTLPLNLVLLFADILNWKLMFYYQLCIVIFICFVYRQILVAAIKELLGSLTYNEKVTFSSVFIAIQFMTVNNFIVSLTGISRLGHLPIFIRIVQNIKIQTKTSLRALGRFLILIIVLELAHLRILWILLKVLVTLWFVFVDYKFCFQLQRIANNGLFSYPSYVYYSMFAIDVMCRWGWVLFPQEVILLGVLRKIIENYFRIESQSANMKNSILKSIVNMAETHDISA